jgi:acyl-coenzyme A thioesterase PaaI-like protein
MAVTLELSTQFVGAGKVDRPLDAVVELVRETGRMMFLRGMVVQEDDTVASFSGIVRKARRKMSPPA